MSMVVAVWPSCTLTWFDYYCYNTTSATAAQPIWLSLSTSYQHTTFL